MDYQLFQQFNGLVVRYPMGNGAVFFVAEYLWLVIAALAFLWLFLPSREQLKVRGRVVLMFLSALAARFIVVELIRLIIPRARPFVTHHVIQLIAKDNESSFPSGHTAFVAALGMSLYFYNKRWGIAVMVLALLIGVARIIAGVHYPTDILGGLVVGILTAMVVERLFTRHIRKIFVPKDLR